MLPGSLGQSSSQIVKKTVKMCAVLRWVHISTCFRKKWISSSQSRRPKRPSKLSSATEAKANVCHVWGCSRANNMGDWNMCEGTIDMEAYTGIVQRHILLSRWSFITFIYRFSKHSVCSRLSGGISSSTTSVQHPPGWCDSSHSVPELPPHTSLLVERRRSDEANQQVLGLLGGHDDQRPIGKFGQDAEVTPLLFSKGIFNDHRESGPRFNVSCEGRCFWQYSFPVTILGH